MKNIYYTYSGILIFDDKEFKKFVRIFKNNLKRSLKDAEIIGFKVNNFISSGFIKMGDKYVYISIPDVRYDVGWCDNILIRTAKHDKDFIGGSNEYVSLLELVDRIKYLLKI